MSRLKIHPLESYLYNIYYIHNKYILNIYIERIHIVGTSISELLVIE